jgi:Protein of unknown function (DUF2804)
MPRILDRIDAAAGRTPAVLETAVDYDQQAPPPPALIGPDGTYNAGWFPRFDGRINLDDSGAFDLALQAWFHVGIDAGRHLIVVNLADLHKASNTAVLVWDRVTGRLVTGSETDLGPVRSVTWSPDARHFHDEGRGSFLLVDNDDECFELSMHVGGLHLTVVARHALGPPYVQVTRFQRGRGSLQWYGNLVVEQGLLVVDGKVIPLPPGSLGHYDRTVGHQRGIQAWNWLAFNGTATHRASGRQAQLGLQFAQDRAAARPAVDHRKRMVWLDGVLRKLPAGAFEYTVLDPTTGATGPWRVHSVEAGPGAYDLHFQPRFVRREGRHRLLVHAVLAQHYGDVSGSIWVEGEEWRVDSLPAVAEESHLEL